MIRPLLHVVLHFLVPGLMARFAFKKERWKVFLLLCSAMIIDMDHLWAEPVYDPDRCSIGFHFLHTGWASVVYCGLVLLPKTRILAIGLLVHLGLDLIDCYMMGGF